MISENSPISNPGILNRDHCFMCGKTPDTLEHIFPKWLLRRYNLWNQRLRLSNGTEIAYRQVVVPACRNCNSVILSQLEDRISQGNPTDLEIWQWACKLHYALEFKDHNLIWDQKNKGPSIGEVKNIHDQFELERHMLHTISGKLISDPAPFGSVFTFTFKSVQPYNFVHLSASKVIAIILDTKGYVIFLKDGQSMLRTFSDQNNQVFDKQHDLLFFLAKMVEYYHRQSKPMPFLFSGDKLVALGSALSPAPREPNREMLSALCKWMGFTWKDADQE